jgi:hypothetical protein
MQRLVCTPRRPSTLSVKLQPLLAIYCVSSGVRLARSTPRRPLRRRQHAHAVRQDKPSKVSSVLVSTPPFIIFAFFFGLCVRRIRSDFLIRKSLPFLALGLHGCTRASWGPGGQSRRLAPGSHPAGAPSFCTAGWRPAVR